MPLENLQLLTRERDLVGRFVVVTTTMDETLFADNGQRFWFGGWWSGQHDRVVAAQSVQRIQSIDDVYGNVRVFLAPAAIWVPLKACSAYTAPPTLYNNELAGPTEDTASQFSPAFSWQFVPQTDFRTPAEQSFVTSTLEHIAAFRVWSVAREDRRESMRANYRRLVAGPLQHHDRLDTYTPLNAFQRVLHTDNFVALAALVRQFVKHANETGNIPTSFRDGFDYGELVRCLNMLRKLDADRARRVFRRLEHVAYSVGDAVTTEVIECDLCGAYEIKDDAVYAAQDDEMFCSTCQGADSVRHSDLMDGYIRRSHAAPVYNSASAAWNNNADDWVTRDWARHNDMHAVEGGWVDEEVYYDYQDRYNNDDDCEDEDCDDNDGLSGYHNGYRDFTERLTDGSPYPALGVELEVWAEDRRAAVTDIRRTTKFLCESDGSLCDTHGFEIITPPLGKPEWAAMAATLLRTCSEQEIKGYNAKDGQYGIHITVHRRHLSPLQEARMMMFMTVAENGPFVKAVAQRVASYGSPQWDMGGDNRSTKRIKDGPCGYLQDESYDAAGIRQRTKGNSGADYSRKIMGVGKYAPICWKSELAEFRVFQSTTHAPSFLKNLEFVWALIEWTSTSSCTGTAWHHEAFVKWLGLRADVLKDYPHLMEYLQREKYIVKGSGGTPIHNTWLPVLLVTLKRSESKDEVDEETAEDTEYAEAA